VVLSEDLLKLTSVVAEAGLPALAGQMMAFALAQPETYYGDDDTQEKKREPESQISRAVEFLRFQIVVAETHIHEAELMAGKLQKENFTPIAYVPPSVSGEEKLEIAGKESELFSQMEHKENWSLKHRYLTIKALGALLDKINGEEH
jgi:hypothetical protein